MREKDNREHSGADRLNLSRSIRGYALSTRDEFKGEFNAGGTADLNKFIRPEIHIVFRDFLFLF